MRQGEAELWRLIAPWMDKQSYLAVRATSATALQDLPSSYYLTRLHLCVESFPGSVSCIDTAGGRLALGYYVRNKRWRLAIRDNEDNTVHFGPPYNPAGGGISISHVALHTLGNLYYAVLLHPLLSGEWQHRLYHAGVAEHTGVGQVESLAALTGGGCAAVQENDSHRSVVLYNSGMQPTFSYNVTGQRASLCPGGPHWLDLHHNSAIWGSIQAPPTDDISRQVWLAPGGQRIPEAAEPHWYRRQTDEWSSALAVRPAGVLLLRSQRSLNENRELLQSPSQQLLRLEPSHRTTALYHSERLLLTADVFNVVRMWSLEEDHAVPLCTLKSYRGGAPLPVPVPQRFISVPQRDGERLLLLDGPSGQWVALQLVGWKKKILSLG